MCLKYWSVLKWSFISVWLSAVRGAPGSSLWPRCLALAGSSCGSCHSEADGHCAWTIPPTRTCNQTDIRTHVLYTFHSFPPLSLSTVAWCFWGIKAPIFFRFRAVNELYCILAWFMAGHSSCLMELLEAKHSLLFSLDKVCIVCLLYIESFINGHWMSCIVFTMEGTIRGTTELKGLLFPG